MIDQPDRQTLLTAMAEALTADVVNQESDDAVKSRYTARIVANLCRVLARELALGPAADKATEADLQRILQSEATGPDLVAQLDERLRRRDHELDPGDLYRVMVADVERRLEVARPGYRNDGTDRP